MNQETLNVPGGRLLPEADGSAKYRDIQDGETLQDGDQVWNPMRNEWKPTVNVGLEVGTAHTSLPYRRPLSPNSQAEARRATCGQSCSAND